MIRFKDVSLAFGQQKILDDLNLAIKAGEKVIISGKSGKGKSTILKLLLGFQTYDSGHIEFDGDEIRKSDLFLWRQKFAYVNQDVTLRLGVVKDIIEDISHYSGNDFNGQVDMDLISLLDFDLELLNKHVDELSGGERQRLGLILAIHLNRPVFLLDEVTSALDENLKKRVVDYFIATNKTVIAVSHDSVWTDNKVFRKVVL